MTTLPKSNIHKNKFVLLPAKQIKLLLWLYRRPLAGGPRPQISKSQNKSGPRWSFIPYFLSYFVCSLKLRDTQPKGWTQLQSCSMTSCLGCTDGTMEFAKDKLQPVQKSSSRVELGFISQRGRSRRLRPPKLHPNCPCGRLSLPVKSTESQIGGLIETS